MNVTGDCNPAKLRTRFRGLEGLKKGVGGAEISSVCRQIALEAGRHGKTIGKDPIAVEMDRTGHTHCTCSLDSFSRRVRVTRRSAAINTASLDCAPCFHSLPALCRFG